VKCVSWHRARGSRWYPADMRAFARAARTALLLWTRVQCAVATSHHHGDAHIHVGVDTCIETVENYDESRFLMWIITDFGQLDLH